MAEALVGNIVRFLEVLRAAGVGLHAGRTSEVVEAIERVGLRRRADVRAALRCLLIHRHDDVAVFDAAFDRFWRTRSARDPQGLPLMALGERPRVAAAPRTGTQLQFEAESDGHSAGATSIATAAWSATESLRTRDFATLSPAELARAEALLAGMPWHLGMRRARRWSPARSGRIDRRSAVRRNMKHGGELLDLPRRARHTRPRPVVVLADVSGSMERYTRMMLQFVHGMTTGPHAVESFVFATRLTRVTREVMRRGSARALSTVAAGVVDWGGGTRIGDALRSFNVHYARRVMRNGPVVIIVSDGWDRGDPQQLTHELARLRRSCRRLVWLNPLLGTATYEPLTRGMQAALPLVHDFLPVHNLESLEQLAAHLRSLEGTAPGSVVSRMAGVPRRRPGGAESSHAD
jgi:uncharacterized protein